MSRIEKVCILFLSMSSIILAIAITLDPSFIRGRDPDEKESPYKQKYDSIQSELKRTSEQRDSLRHTIITLDSINSSLLLVRSKLDNELKSIKGKYKSYTNKQLEDEMERRVTK